MTILYIYTIVDLCCDNGFLKVILHRRRSLDAMRSSFRAKRVNDSMLIED